MNTNETGNDTLKIRTNEKNGEKYSYFIRRETWGKVADALFSRAMSLSKDSSQASGGAVSGALHAYGLKEEKMQGSGVRPFPKPGEEFTEENLGKWLQAMAWKAPHVPGTRKTAKEVQMDAALATLALPGITWEVLAPAYKGITLEDLEAYKLKLAGGEESEDEE